MDIQRASSFSLHLCHAFSSNALSGDLDENNWSCSEGTGDEHSHELSDVFILFTMTTEIMNLYNFRVLTLLSKGVESQQLAPGDVNNTFSL